MGAQGSWFITPHAVARYREKIDSRASYAAALARLVEMSTAAHRVSVQADGVEVWRVGKRHGRLRFKVHSAHGDELPQLLTVLPSCEAYTTQKHGE
jgi:hypothetical protein